MYVLSREINKNKNSFHGPKYIVFFFTCNAKILVIKATFCKFYHLHKKIFISYIVKDNFGIQQHSQFKFPWQTVPNSIFYKCDLE